MKYLFPILFLSFILFLAGCSGNKSSVQQPVVGSEASQCLKYPALMEQADCLTSLALEKRDRSFCDLISQPSPKYSCYSEFAVQNGNPRLCSDIPADYSSNNSYFIDECYQNVAVANSSESICDSIKSSELTSSVNVPECYLAVAVKQVNSSICKKISDGQVKYNCFEQVAAKAPLNESALLLICNNAGESFSKPLENQLAKDACIASYAKSHNTLDSCRFSGSEFAKDVCYFDVARSNKSLIACDKIEDEKMKGACKTEIESYLS